jgi:peptide chain release factor 3
LFARDRETIDEAFPGDVVGVVNPGLFTIGDTLSSNSDIEYERMPSFQPEHFCSLRNEDVSRSKQFRKGIEQLAEEGVVQVYYGIDSIRREPILGAVGQLQFDVVEARFLQEYSVKVISSPLPYVCARWPKATLEDVRHAFAIAHAYKPKLSRCLKPPILTLQKTGPSKFASRCATTSAAYSQARPRTC